jgi:hypothetical protein
VGFTFWVSGLLKLFSAGIPENHLFELKKVIAKFLLDKAEYLPVMYIT